MKNILTAAALILMAATLHNIFAATPDTPPAAAHDATVTSETPTQPKATDANIYGHIISLDRQEHIPYVTVSVKGTAIGTTADATGHYYLKNLPEGPCTIVAEAIGYSTVEQQVVMKRNKTVELNFVMQEQTLAMDEVVVSATRNVTNKRSSAVIVNVASAKLFDRTASTDLAETMKFQSGLRIENNCGNCGTKLSGQSGPLNRTVYDPIMEDRQTPAEPPRPDPRPAPPVPPSAKGETGSLSSTSGATTVLGVTNGTTVLGGAEPLPQYPYLIREKDGTRTTVDKPSFRIGKEGRYCDLFLYDNTAISRSHADIVTRDGRYFVVDRNSTNHTYVEGRLIPPEREVELYDNTHLRLANENFTFHLK